MTQVIAPGSRAGTAIIGRYLPRLLGAFIVVWGAATLAFLVLHLVPGDPVDIMLGSSRRSAPEIRAQIREELGLNQPILGSSTSATWARSRSATSGCPYRLQRPVTEVIGGQLRADRAARRDRDPVRRRDRPGHRPFRAHQARALDRLVHRAAGHLVADVLDRPAAADDLLLQPALVPDLRWAG